MDVIETTEELDTLGVKMESLKQSRYVISWSEEEIEIVRGDSAGDNLRE